jgi:two-component system chemotaxis response regulator CheY
MSDVGARTLIVDDSRLTRTIIRNILEPAGYRIVGEAVNGREGVEMTAALHPDLITVDLTMPEKGGLESMDELRQAHPAAKIIVVTALGSQTLLRQDLMRAGVVAVLAKPFNPFDLVRTANLLLGRPNSPQEPPVLHLPAVSLPWTATADGKLTALQINDLMELGNIGAGNAASRLSDMIGERCLISPPKVAFLNPEGVLDTFAAADSFMASLGVKVLGDIPAVMVVVLGRDQAPNLLRLMTRKSDPEKKGDALSSAARFALRQVGEFLTRAFSQAVQQFLSDRLSEAIPEISIDDSAQSLETTLRDGSGKDPYLLIHCGFSDMAHTFEGKLAYLLSPSSQKKVLARLGELLTPVQN